MQVAAAHELMSRVEEGAPLPGPHDMLLPAASCALLLLGRDGGASPSETWGAFCALVQASEAELPTKDGSRPGTHHRKLANCLRIVGL